MIDEMARVDWAVPGVLQMVAADEDERMSTALFILAGLVCVIAVLVEFSQGGGAVPNIEQAADVMGERMFLDGCAKRAANENDWDLLAVIDSAREALEALVESQGYTNDDSARWLEGGKEAWEAIRQELEAG